VGKLLDNTYKAGGDQQLKENVLKKHISLGSFSFLKHLRLK